MLNLCVHLLQVGGNQRAREFLDSQPDYDDTMSIQQKYNTKAAALYRDKITTLAQGKSWSAETSSAANYSSSSLNAAADSHRSTRNTTNGQRNSAANSNSSRGYQDFDDNSASQGGYQNFNTTEFRDQKQQFFNRIQEENASRPE